MATMGADHRSASVQRPRAANLRSPAERVSRLGEGSIAASVSDVRSGTVGMGSTFTVRLRTVECAEKTWHPAQVERCLSMTTVWRGASSSSRTADRDSRTSVHVTFTNDDEVLFACRRLRMAKVPRCSVDRSSKKSVGEGTRAAFFRYRATYQQHERW